MLTHAAERGAAAPAARCRRGRERPCAAAGGGGTARTAGPASRASADALRMHWTCVGTTQHPLLLGRSWRWRAAQRRSGAPRARHRAGGGAGARRDARPGGSAPRLRGLSALAAVDPPPPLSPLPPRSARGGRKGGHAGGRGGRLFCRPVLRSMARACARAAAGLGEERQAGCERGIEALRTSVAALLPGGSRRPGCR